MKSVFTTIANRMSYTPVAFTKTVLLVCCLLGAIGSYANIDDLSASTSNGHLPSGTTEVIVAVSFTSNTMEYADFIGFNTNNGGVTLDFGVSGNPSPYIDCGLDRGTQSTMGDVSWMRPGFAAGNSGCGAFRSGEIHYFPLIVTDDGSNSSGIVLTVTVVGDGNGETTASVETTTVTLLPIDCEIQNCPSTIMEVAGADGMADVNVPVITTTGSCNQLIQQYSGMYPIGTTTVTVQANSTPSVSCTFDIVVTDETNPELTGCNNITRDLGTGECGAVIDSPLQVTDNGNDIAVALSQHNTAQMDLGVSCPAGVTTYYRVFDTDDYDIDTELQIASVDFAVLETTGGQSVTATIYQVEGGFPGGTLTELGSTTQVISGGSEFMVNVPVTAIVDAGQTFAVAITAQGSLFGGPVLATSFDGETEPSYVQAAFCGFAQPTTFANADFPGQSLILTVNGVEAATKIRQVDNSGFAIGDTFPIGVYNLEFEAVDASGNTDVCAFSVQVNELSNPTGSITCNDQVNVALDLDCTATITPDQVLEGDMYGCFDDFTVQIENAAGVQYGNTIDGSMIGMTLKVRVTGPNGNSCWGNILIEDKGATPLECQTVYTTCTGDLTPGSPISPRVTFGAEVSDPTISDAAPASYDYSVPVFGLVGSTITDVNVVFDVDHDRVADLTATLTAPDGTAVALFSAPADGCGTTTGLRVTMDDQAMNSYASLQSSCDAALPLLQGGFVAEGILSTFNGEDPNGDWTVNLSDTGAGMGGTVNSISIVFTQAGGSVVFPTTNPTTFVNTGANQYEVTGIDGCGPVTAVYTDDVEDQPCTSPYREIISRTWNVQDEQGNQSDACTQRIFVFRNDLSTLEFPMHFDGVDGRPTLSCSQYGDVVPDSTVTGVPTGDFCDNVQIFPYEDQIIDVCPKSYKIIRRWRLLEWCSGDVLDYNQIIKVEDTEGPVLSAPADVTMSARPTECSANHTAITPTIVRECSDNVSYEVSYLVPGLDGLPDASDFYQTDNVVSLGGQFVVTDLPLGTSRIKWVVTDECGNFSETTYEVTVIDDVPPVAVCDEFTVTSIGSDGLAYVHASTFDDLSIDNCTEVTYLARKMTDACGADGSGTSQLKEEIIFCCAEIGTTIMVEMVVTDANGNSNSCMVEVTVDSKLPPYITECPADITLDCQADYEDLSVTGEPKAIDNCAVVDVRYIDFGDIDQCGRGTITRTWTVEDAQGAKNSCVQFITLEDQRPFSRSDISFPRDYDATTCYSNLDPENLPAAFQRPVLADDICSLAAVDYEDQKFAFVEGSCEKILRTWTVIDWCTYNPNVISSTTGLPVGLYRDIQVIKLENTVAPEITDGCNAIELCSYDDCGGVVQLTKQATDDCTPVADLSWTWSLDVNADGTIDNVGSGNVVNADLQDGNHEITWVVEDRCGNTDICRQPFTVVDCKKPTPYCRSSVTTVVMPSSGMIDIWARDYELGSTDNCTDSEDLVFSFSRTLRDSSRVFSCADILDGESMLIELEMWVTDKAGNQDFCTVALILQDGIDNVCDDSGSGTLTATGTIQLDNGQTLGDATVTIDGPYTDDTQTMATTDDGAYMFADLQSGLDYTVSVEKVDGVDEGVSTLDLVLMQRHIIALAPFTDPYDMIAADIDDNDRVSGADIVALRKVILGINSDFPNGQDSWRFVRSDASMSVSDALPYSEQRLISNIQHSVAGQDFVAVKIGDINDSAMRLRSGSQLDNRSASQAHFVTDAISAEAGEVVSIPIYLENISTLTGYQLALYIDTDAVHYLGVESGQIDITADHVTFVDQELRMSWSDFAVADIKSDVPLFYINVESNTAQSLHNAIRIAEGRMTAEVYDNNLDVYPATLTVRSSDLMVFGVEQNVPNPFDNETVIGFYVPDAGAVNIKITDLAGRVLVNSTQQYDEGRQSYLVNAADLGSTGVLFYTVSTERESVTKRMIAIR